MLTWAVVFLNADGTIYGRYGSRGARQAMKDNDKDISLAGFRKAAEGALEIHQAYPGNKAALSGKRGGPGLASTPEKLPAAPPEQAHPAGPERHGCIHCHMVQEWELVSAWKLSRPVPDSLLWPYPPLATIGLTLDLNERATISRVGEGSVAAGAGFRQGDRIVTLGGQPIISIADVEWVLHQAAEPSTLKAEVEREGRKEPLDLPLAAGWRRGGDFVETLSLGWTARHLIAGMRCREVVPDEKLRLGLSANALALSVREITSHEVEHRSSAAEKVGLQRGDVIIEVDGLKTAMTEIQFLAYLIQKKKPGQKVDLTYLREGKAKAVQLELPPGLSAR
jgi:membrane-associated protease RseP (regulator of RpoE activity)